MNNSGFDRVQYSGAFVFFFLNRVNAILIGCRCYRKCSPLFQEQIDEIGMWEGAKARLSPALEYFFVEDLLRALGDEGGALSSETGVAVSAARSKGYPVRAEVGVGRSESEAGHGNRDHWEACLCSKAPRASCSPWPTPAVQEKTQIFAPTRWLPTTLYPPVSGFLPALTPSPPVRGASCWETGWEGQVSSFGAKGVGAEPPSQLDLCPGPAWPLEPGGGGGG